MSSWLDKLIAVAREQNQAPTAAPMPMAAASPSPYLGQGAPMPGAGGASHDEYMRAMLELLKERPR